jgi:hypothetical protein
LVEDADVRGCVGLARYSTPVGAVVYVFEVSVLGGIEVVIGFRVGFELPAKSCEAR